MTITKNVQIISGILILYWILTFTHVNLQLIYERTIIIEKPTPELLDNLGRNIAAVGVNIVVAAPFVMTGPGYTRGGEVYMFDPESGNLVTTLSDPTPKHSGRFGESIAVLDNLIIVAGSMYNDPSASFSGKIYLFDGDPASATFGDILASFVNPEAQKDYDAFGISVAALGNIVAVGAYSADVGAVNNGAVYLFDGDKNSGSFGQLLNTIPGPGGLFGWWIAAMGKNLLVTAPNNRAVYLYDADPASGSFGSLLHTFLSPETAYIQFGHRVASEGSKVIVSATNYKIGGYNAGAVYIFDGGLASPTFGDLLLTIVNPAPSIDRYEGFGYSIFAHESYILIGNYSDNTFARSAGEAYLYGYDGSLIETFVNPYPDDFDYFGMGIAMLGDDVFVGAPNEDMSASNAGVVYFYPAVSGPQTGEKAIEALLEDISEIASENVRSALVNLADSAMVKIVDENPANDVAACGKLGACINKVEAQRGNKLSEEEADRIIASSQLALDLIEACSE